MIQFVSDRSDNVISSIHFKNYKSFPELTLNLSKTKKKPQNLIVIYGENGSGKSNIIDAIEILRLSVSTLSYHNQFIKLQQLMNEDKNSLMSISNMTEIITKSSYSSVKKILENSKMIGSKKNLLIQYNLFIDQKEAEYLIEYDGNKLVREQLKYTVEKGKGLLFEININKESEKILVNLNDKIFSKNIQKDLLVEIEKFWGLHTFFSIINVYIENLNQNFIDNSISDNLFDILYFLESISVSSSKATTLSTEMLKDLNSGSIKIGELEELEKNEVILYKFFTSLYTDIKDVYYKKSEDIEEAKIDYRLYFKKNIGGKMLEIPFNLESSGTKKLLKLLPMFMGAVNGKTVVIDEIDQGIHDVLMNNIIESIQDDITGQLIFSTHDTYLLQKINPNSAYFIAIDVDGNKQIKNIKEYKDVRVFKNNNVQLQYLAGSYEAIPYPMSIDFEDLNYELNGEGDQEE